MRPKILIVDPNAYIRHLLGRMLQDAGAETTEAVDGREAFKLLYSLGRPDAVILEPEIFPWDGWTLMRQMKAHPTWKSIPIIVCSSKSRREDVLKARSLGAVGYVVKPDVRRDLLIPMLRRALSPRSAGAPAPKPSAIERESKSKASLASTDKQNGPSVTAR